jgi:hypothetical protein
LNLDLGVLGAEANSARESSQQDDSALYRWIVQASVEPDWSLLTQHRIDPKLVSEGILHPCPLIGLCAAKIIVSGVGVAEAANLIPTALESHYEHPVRLAVAVAETCLGNDASDLFIARLERPIHIGHKWLFVALARDSRSEQRARVQGCFSHWLTVDNPEVATGIAEAMSESDPKFGIEMVDGLRIAYEHWTRCGSRCEEHGTTILGGSCPECHVVPPSPRSALLKELNRLNAVSFEELVGLTNDARHDVSDLAKSSIVENAGLDEDVFCKVIDLVDAKRLPSALLGQLLKLPIEQGSVVAMKAERLLDSADVDVRLAVIGQLTGEWIDREHADEFLRRGLLDPEPAIRTLATRILRLLE